MQADHAGCPMTEKPLNVRPAEIAKMKIKLAPSYLATSAPNHELQRKRVSRERTELYDILQCRENPTNRSYCRKQIVIVLPIIGITLEEEEKTSNRAMSRVLHPIINFTDLEDVASK